MKELIQVNYVQDPKECFAIRKEVFIKEQQVPKELELDEFDQTAIHVLATYDGEPCGCARYREFSDYIKVERVAVLEQFRSKGIAKKIMIFIEDAVDKKEKTIFLNAQDSVIGFYQSLGYQGEGDIFIEAGIKHLKMKKTPNFGGLS